MHSANKVTKTPTNSVHHPWACSVGTKNHERGAVAADFSGYGNALATAASSAATGESGGPHLGSGRTFTAALIRDTSEMFTSVSVW